MAARVLHRTLEMTARMLAPFTPFMAEWVWRTMEKRDDEDSIPFGGMAHGRARFQIDRKVMETMRIVRDVVTRSLEARMAAKIPCVKCSDG